MLAFRNGDSLSRQGWGGGEGRAVRDGLTGVLAFGCGGALDVWAAKGKGSGLEGCLLQGGRDE